MVVSFENANNEKGNQYLKLNYFFVLAVLEVLLFVSDFHHLESKSLVFVVDSCLLYM